MATLLGSAVIRIRPDTTGFEQQAKREIADPLRKVSDAAGVALLAVGTAGAGLLTAAVKSASEFEQSMAGVRAATRASGDELNVLREAALKAGAGTKYSATEAAQGIEELAKAGLSAKDIVGGGLNGALALAATGNLGVAESAEVAASALSTFGLKGSDAGHVADLLAAGAGSARGEVSDLAQAFSQAALVADSTGLSIEETTGTLAAFAQAGLLGSDAGTSLKTALQMLSNPSNEARETMERLGISAYDASGNFVGMSDLAGQLQTSMADLTPEARNAALAVIFGSDAVRAANVLYAEGSAGIEKWTATVDQTGYAAEQAAIRMDTLAGDVETLKGAIDTAFIGSAEGANAPLRDLVQNLTDAVDWYNNLGEGAQGAALNTLGVVTAAGLVGGAFLTLGPRVLEVVTSFNRLKTDSPQVADNITKVGKAAGIAGAAFAALQIAGAAMDLSSGAVLSMAEATRLLADSGTGLEQIDASFAAIASEGNYRGIDTLQGALNTLANPSLIDRMNDVAGSVLGVVGLPYENGRPERDALIDQFESMGGALSSLVNSGHADRAAAQFATISEAASRAGISQEVLLDLMPQYRDALAQQDAQQTLAAQSATGMADAVEGTVPALGAASVASEETQAAIEALANSLAGFVDPVGTFNGLLDAKIAKEAEAKASTDGVATEGVEDWNRYLLAAKVSIDEYNAKLQEQVTAQTNWKENLLSLSSQVSSGTLEELTRMGAEGAPLVQALADSSIEDIRRFDELTTASVQSATTNWATTLTNAQPVIRDIASRLGQGAADEAAAKLANGTSSIEAIMRDYGVAIANGVNPVLSQLGAQQIAVNRARTTAGNGRTYTGYADGGIAENHVAQIAPAGAWRVWAEPETGGEAYIPLAASKRSRSVDIWHETGRRLGMPPVDAFADGGFTTAGAVPPVPSYRPFNGQIPSPSVRASEIQRQWALKVAGQYETMMASLVGGAFGSSAATPNGVGGLGPAAAAARAFVQRTFGISNIGGYANRNIAGTGTKSDHALGKAIDVMIGNYKSAAGIAQGNAVANRMTSYPGVKYIIWKDQINSGSGWRPYGHPGGGRSDTLQHRDHVHVSMYDQGGLLPHGGVGINLSGKPERVLTGAQTERFDRALAADSEGDVVAAVKENTAETRALRFDLSRVGMGTTTIYNPVAEPASQTTQRQAARRALLPG